MESLPCRPTEITVIRDDKPRNAPPMTKGRPRSNRNEKPGWATRFAEARHRAGFSQESLGAKMSYAQSSIGAWESGKSEPKLATIERFAGVFGVSPAWLAFGIGDPAEGDPLAFSEIERRKHDKLFSFAFIQSARLFSEEGLNMDLAYLTAYTVALLRKTQGSDSGDGAQERITAALDIERAQIRAEMDEFRKKRL